MSYTKDFIIYLFYGNVNYLLLKLVYSEKVSIFIKIFME